MEYPEHNGQGWVRLVALPPAAQYATWDFQAVVIWPDGTTQPTTDPNDPQSNVCSPFTVVETDDDHMKVNDDNQDQPGKFNYQIWIKTSEGTYVGSDPVILNKGGD